MVSPELAIIIDYHYRDYPVRRERAGGGTPKADSASIHRPSGSSRDYPVKVEEYTDEFSATVWGKVIVDGTSIEYVKGKWRKGTVLDNK